jgi:DNA polymerase-3 subunit delta
MAAGNTLTFEQLRKSIEALDLHPVYLFMGEESYYIDVLTDLLSERVIPQESRDFNQTIVYGPDTDVHSLISALRRFPMMSERQLVVVKEAQGLKNIEVLESYLHNPMPSTVLVLNYKHGLLDKRKKIYSEINKRGVVFESNKIYDNKVPGFITSHVASLGLGIDAKSAQMLTDFLGNDLKKVVNEIDKLRLSIPPNEKRITPELIEQNIGLSKDFNNFELLRAVIDKDFTKAEKIAFYFERNPKNNPYLVTLSVLFNYFSNLLVCYWATDKSENGLARELGLRSDFQARDYVTGLRNYKVMKTMENIALLRTYDAKGKGVDNPSSSTGELLKELLFKLMH